MHYFAKRGRQVGANSKKKEKGSSREMMLRVRSSSLRCSQGRLVATTTPGTKTCGRSREQTTELDKSGKQDFS